MPITIAFAIIIIGPWLFGRASKAFRLPAILGMLLFGIAYAALSGGVTDLLPPLPGEIDAISGFLKSTALIVILLRAGLGIRKASLQAVGASAFRMAIIPCLAETAVATLAFYWFFGFDPLTALVGASILAAVSPAVVVPSMLDLKERGYTEVPTLVLAGASIDDAVAITIFTASVGLLVGGSATMVNLIVSFPLAILNGLVVGVALGFFAAWFFTRTFTHIRATEKALLLVVVSLLLLEIEQILPIAGLLGVMTVGFILLERAEPVAHEMAHKLSKLWVPAEILLFVLIGLAVDLPAAWQAGGRGLAVIALGLAGRSLGVLISVAPDRSLNWSERLFALIAYLPKATVQAALGAIPLSLGIAGGQEILSVAVLAIIVTAPLGLILIRAFGPRLLSAPENAI
ncbi:MAG: peptidase [Spirochaetaceae bacterium]|nr:MAG: peptidase [Spirochaetaceae bacterium]